MSTDEPSGGPKLPYGKQTINDEDVEAVIEALRSDWLTTGPRVIEFEEALARTTGAQHAVAVNSGTAALHAAMFALNISSGDEVIVPSMTFAATANCVVYQGGTPVFADVNPGTLLIDPQSVEQCITPRTKAVIAVDYAGQPCGYRDLEALARHHGIALVADAAHSLGGRYGDRPVGSLADLSTFSFHPVKHITTGEGGAITTNDGELAKRMRQFRNHGITSDHREREASSSWRYEMVDLGYNYRITDFQCALGISQLRRLGAWVSRRQEIAASYDHALADVPWIGCIGRSSDVYHAYHLYVVRVDSSAAPLSRDGIFSLLRTMGIGVNVHYIPVHLHPYYRHTFGTHEGMCPAAEAAYAEILSLPVFPSMSISDVQRVVDGLRRVRTGH